MFAVERLGSYIKGGIGKVSRPLQPFGGAVDIIVVEQPDGTFKSCPWYVRFGKSQGALKPVEKVISINVNGVDADFLMYLDNNGDAYFLREVDGEDGQAEFYPSAYGDEKVLSPRIRRMQKSKSCDYDVNQAELVSEFEAANGNMQARGTSRQSVFSLPFGRRSIKEGDSQKGEGAFRATTSLERAEMAADLLEVRWTTNLRTGEKWSVNPPQVPKPKFPVAGVFVSKVGLDDAPNMKNSLMNGHDDSKLDSSASYEVNGASFAPGWKKSLNKESNVEIPCSLNLGNNEEIYTLAETCVGVDLASDGSDASNRVDNCTIDKDRNVLSDSKVSASILKVSGPLEFEQKEGCFSSGEEHSCSRNVLGAGLTESGNVTNSVDPSMFCATKENTILHLVEHSEQSNGTILVAVESLTGSKDQLSVVNTVLKGEMDVKDYQNPYNTVRPKQVADAEDDNVEHIACCNGYEEASDNVIESENSDEEQFSFTDLHDFKINKVDLVGVSPPDDRKECLPQDFPDSNEEITGTYITSREPHPAADKLIQDDRPSIKFESKGVSSPISIRKNHHDAEMEFITPVTESLPIMHLVGNNLDELGVPQPLSRSLDSNFEAMQIVSDDDQDYSEAGVHYNSQISEEIKSIISDPAIEVSLCRHLLCEGMGYEAAALVFDDGKLNKDKFASLGPNIVKDDTLVVRIGGLYFPWDEALPIASAIGSQGRGQVLEAKGMIPVGQSDIRGQENPQKNMHSRNGSWKLWPFSYKRTSSAKSLASESASRNPVGKDRNTGKDENVGKDGGRKEYVDAQKDESTEKDRNTGKEGDTKKDECTEKEGNTEKSGMANIDGRKVTKKKIRAKIPSSEQLASLNLKEGNNIVTFSFTTTTLGKQQVDARIFLWKWDTRIVISDVDGTITKSDVLGHVMPLMGMDWSQTGVTHLFSAIKENGYQLLFLSARSILQASRTRQFLINLKQDGKVLPEGPIVISPDGLFPSLYREVIRRAPHEFKISCLEAIKALFPRDHNPFYAGFGNRDTDELSYMKVGIPKGKIFTINPKGEVAINRRVDTKSYNSLHTLVHDMFPPTMRIEQEDFNTWNFWRLPHLEL